LQALTTARTEKLVVRKSNTNDGPMVAWLREQSGLMAKGSEAEAENEEIMEGSQSMVLWKKRGGSKQMLRASPRLRLSKGPLRRPDSLP